MIQQTTHESSRAARMALAYITVGALTMIWCALWYWRIQTIETPPESLQHLFCLGFFLSGAALLVIGLLVGRIGLEARNADVPATMVTPAVAAPPQIPVSVNGVATTADLTPGNPMPIAASTPTNPLTAR